MAADGLSRRPRTESDDTDESVEVDIDDFIEAELNSLWIAPLSVQEEQSVGYDLTTDKSIEPVLDGEYSQESLRIVEYLTTLRKPEQITTKEFRKFKTHVLKHQVQNKTLFRRAGKYYPQTRVINIEGERALILKQLHDETGHKGRESTYWKVADRYY
jgi:hypothetical protein